MSETPEKYRGAIYRLYKSLLRSALSVRDFPCWLLGHVVVDGPLRRSPNTVYTHWQDMSCQRCGKVLWSETHYIDARSPARHPVNEKTP